MPSTEIIELSDYKAIFVAYEQDYRSSRGTERQAIMKEILKDIVAQSKGKLSKETTKGLDKVSQPTGSDV